MPDVIEEVSDLFQFHSNNHDPRVSFLRRMLFRRDAYLNIVPEAVEDGEQPIRREAGEPPA